MAIHNWVRCHWRNGRHDLQDLPEEWRATLESHLARQRTRADDLGVVHVACVESLAIAWVVCEVPLGAGECGFTYRRARAVHALVRPLATGRAWEVREAETLLGQRYGEPVSSGLAAQHRALSQLDFPEDAGKALGLFVGHAQALPSELVHAPALTPRDAGNESAPRAAATAGVDRSPHAQAEAIDSTPALERWFERFTLISRKPAGADLEGPARPAAIDVCVERADPPRPVEELEPAPLAPPAQPASLVGPARETPAKAEAGMEATVEDELVPEDEADTRQAPEALFDLSSPPAARVAPPPSSLSGLLGPSHTTAG